MKKALKTITHKTLSGSKKIISKNPKLKASLKRAILPHINFQQSDSRDKYQKWLPDNFPNFLELVEMRRESKKFKYQPLISIIVPTYNTNLNFLKVCFDSVVAQAYENWELVVVDDCSPSQEVRDFIVDYANNDPRFKYKFLEKNLNISGASNEAVKLAKGEFIGIFDHDDLLWPNALFEVVKALNKDKKIDFIYTDEDKITENTFEHLGYFLKPDYNPDFMYSVNYFTHFTVVRKSLWKKIGGERSEYNGAQDWDLYLRIMRETKNIHHIPKILYSWRIHDQSTAKSTDAKPYVVDAQRKAIQDDLKAKGWSNAVVKQVDEHPGYWRVDYPVVGNPKVSIIIPSKNQYNIVKRCVDSIFSKTNYKNFEIILVDTGSDDPRVLKYYDRIGSKNANFKLVNWNEQPFSYARACNEGAKQASGEFLIMLNNDTEVLQSDWIDLFIGDAQREEIGAVGNLLFYPDKTHIQHAGVGVGLGGVAANSFQMMTLKQPMTQTQHLYINTKHNMTAVTAACLAVRKSVFDEVGGFDENYRITYNDVDLCLRIHEKGYRNLYSPFIRLIHHESISLGTPDEVKKRDSTEFIKAKNQFKKQWSKYIKHDPDINDNIDKRNSFYDIP